MRTMGGMHFFLESYSQNEYYLTDCFKIACQKGLQPFVFETKNYQEFSGINDQDQLNELASWMEKRS